MPGIACPKNRGTSLRKIIEFHHPSFTRKRTTSFPDIEQLLTEMVVNLQMFEASRPAEGSFTKKQLEEPWEILLFTIAEWFHEIYEDASTTDWLDQLSSGCKTKTPPLFHSIGI